MAKRRIRCAVYTRKSSEEGLDQSFNSIEAQQDACRAFIRSQKHEGWTALAKRYDDGGFSGGSMDRPALKGLLDDIKDGKVDTVVVYKVDRLTRSLADFAKMIELFEAKDVTFVSVTQQLNTTTSMGRLTLNVLLSFAQFEREITGERIRDKVAASKRKGMWMGGCVPLGYDSKDRCLVVNKAEAETVCAIFGNYLRLGCVRRLKHFLDERGIRSKIRTAGTGRDAGGRPFSRGALYRILTNRIYVGETVHKQVFYPGQHEAIVPRKLWKQAAALLEKNNQAHRKCKAISTPSLLTGKLFDAQGVRFTPTHTVKNGRRYRYYTSRAAIEHAKDKPPIARLSAHQFDNIVLSEIKRLLGNPEKWQGGLKDGPARSIAKDQGAKLQKNWNALSSEQHYDIARKILRCVTIAPNRAWIEISRASFIGALLKGTVHEATIAGEAVIKLSAEFHTVQRGVELRLVPPEGYSQATPVPALVNTISRARDWYDQVVSGKIRSVRELADASGLLPRHTRRILGCMVLSPRVVEAILTGKHRPDLSVKEFLKPLPIDWEEQEKRILRIA